MKETFRVELYNITFRCRTVANGWGVMRFVDGCRNAWVAQFGADEKTAREVCAFLS